jgi:hypothetical protein
MKIQKIIIKHPSIIVCWLSTGTWNRNLAVFFFFFFFLKLYKIRQLETPFRRHFSFVINWPKKKVQQQNKIKKLLAFKWTNINQMLKFVTQVNFWSIIAAGRRTEWFSTLWLWKGTYDSCNTQLMLSIWLLPVGAGYRVLTSK